jgi:Cys-tRNA synthase (O-phospho-L-seryl-tRNA:Cys-tRNA synthase)
LSDVNIKDKIETKGNVKYLSWSFAWETLKAHYPTAKRIVYENPSTGLNYFTDGYTAYVKVGIEVEGIENIDYLPIMDFRNQSIRLDKLTSMDVNKAIQRSTAKAIAMHGLGLQLWTGEDMPEMVTAKPQAKVSSKTQGADSEATEAKELPTLMVNSDDYTKVFKYVQDNAALGAEKVIKQIERKYKLTTIIKKILIKEITK